MELSVMDRINLILSDPEKATMTLGPDRQRGNPGVQEVRTISNHTGSRIVLQEQVFRPEEDGRRRQPIEREDRTAYPEKTGGPEGELPSVEALDCGHGKRRIWRSPEQSL